MHWNDVSLLMFEQVPLLKHGPDAHGLRSFWHDAPVLYWKQRQTYFSWESSTQMPWLEQLAKHADKSPEYVSNTAFSWVPELLRLNIADALGGTDVLSANDIVSI